MPLLILLIIGAFIFAIYNNPTVRMRMNPKMALGGVVVVLVLLFLVASIRVVPAGHVGVVDFFGRVSPKYLKPGINLVNPLVRVVSFSVRTQEDKETMTVPSQEGLNVSLDISILYKLEPNAAVNAYKTVGSNYAEVVLVPQYRAVARGVTVGYDAKALYTSEREALAQQFQETLQDLVKERGIVIEKVLLRAITLPPKVANAIELKLESEQEAERMKFVLQKEGIEADRKRVEAEGIKDAQSIINQSLTSQYLQYLWINTLNKNPNVIYVATEANMPLFRVIENK